MSKNENEEIIQHEDQSDIYDFLKAPVETCIGCRFIRDNNCNNQASFYYAFDVRDDTVIDGICDHKYFERDIDNMRIEDFDTKELL